MPLSHGPGVHTQCGVQTGTLVHRWRVVGCPPAHPAGEEAVMVRVWMFEDGQTGGFQAEYFHDVQTGV